MSKEQRDTWGTEIDELGRHHVRYLEASYAELARKIVTVNRFTTLTCLAVTENVQDNVESTCELLDALKGKEELSDRNPCVEILNANDEPRSDDVRIYVMIESPEEEYILDAANEQFVINGQLSPRLQLAKLRKEPQSALQLLETVPLYSVLDETNNSITALRPADQEDLQVLLFGCGAYSEEVLKAVLWQGQMVNVRLEVLVIGEHAREFQERMYGNNPALKDDDRFNLEFHDLELNPVDIATFVNQAVTSEHVYVIIAVEDDARSFELAISLRRIFFDHFAGRRFDVAKRPIIACLVRNGDTASRVSSELDLKNNHYAIHAFGCTQELFSFEKVVNSALEQASALTNELYGLLSKGMKGVALNVEPLDAAAIQRGMNQVMHADPAIDNAQIRRSRPIGNLPQIQYWSNVASASHARYKSWAMGVTDAGSFNEYLEEGGVGSLRLEAVKAFGVNEHDRWTVFYETQGFTYLDEDQQTRFARTLGGDNGRQKVEGLKKHTMICPYDEVWPNYLHAKSGFSYEDASPRKPGNATIAIMPDQEIPSQLDGSIAMQLLDDDFRVIRDFTLNNGKQELTGLSDGRYWIHPTQAISGFECAADTGFEIAGGQLKANDTTITDGILSVKVEGNPWVNPVAYDIAFAIVAPYLVNKLGWTAD